MRVITRRSNGFLRLIFVLKCFMCYGCFIHGSSAGFKYSTYSTFYVI